MLLRQRRPLLLLVRRRLGLVAAAGRRRSGIGARVELYLVGRKQVSFIMKLLRVHVRSRTSKRED